MISQREMDLYFSLRASASAVGCNLFSMNATMAIAAAPMQFPVDQQKLA